MSFLKFVVTLLWRRSKRRLVELLIALIMLGLVPGTVVRFLLDSPRAGIGTVALFVASVFIWMLWITYKDPEHHF